MNVEGRVLKSRPYGDISILYKNELVNTVNIIRPVNDRTTAVKISASGCEFILLFAYHSADYCDNDSYNN